MRSKGLLSETSAKKSVSSSSSVSSASDDSLFEIDYHEKLELTRQLLNFDEAEVGDGSKPVQEILFIIDPILRLKREVENRLL